MRNLVSIKRGVAALDWIHGNIAFNIVDAKAKTTFINNNNASKLCSIGSRGVWSHVRGNIIFTIRYGRAHVAS
jgi:hypothetical protein